MESRGISGGQRKRVSIGMEMITDPSILFLDEATSGACAILSPCLKERYHLTVVVICEGLDSSTAYTLIEKLKNLASMGRTIISTIHQPRLGLPLKFCQLSA